MDFRKMRRKRQQLSDEETLEIVKSANTAILGVLGEDGYPYTVPVNYVYADGKVFIHGAKTGHKTDAIRHCDKVSMCIIEKDDVVAEELTSYYRSVILFGRARILESRDEIIAATRLLGLKYSTDKEFVEREISRELKSLGCIEIDVEHMTGKEAIELTNMRPESSLDD